MKPNGSIDLFRVAGIQIAVDVSWFVIFVLVLWSLAAGYFPLENPGHSWTQCSSSDPDKKVKAMTVCPMSTGRSFDEVLRLLDCCRLTVKHTVATPVNWKGAYAGGARRLTCAPYGVRISASGAACAK